LSKHPLRGLYCITDPKLLAQSCFDIETMVRQAIAGGAQLIQYRDKSSSPPQQHEIASRLCEICQAHSVIFLVNDDPLLAKAVNAHGVHLGQTDTGLPMARKILGEEKIIGISCHDSLALAGQAQQQGADYVAFGRFFASQTKPEARPAPIALLAEAKAALHIPIVAIGGITVDNATELLLAGADMLAVINHVFGQQDIQQAAAKISRLFSPQRT